MSDDNLTNLTRRKVLGSIGAIGAGAALGGAGTMAFFSDDETFTNNELVAGSLDLKVDWTESYNGEIQEQFPEPDAESGDGSNSDTDPCSAFADVPQDLESPVIDLDDVKPGDWGEVTFSLHLCDNPGYIWLNGALMSEAENGETEPESLVDETEGGELADAIEAVVWYDEDCDNRLDVENHDMRNIVGDGMGEQVILHDSLANVLEALETDPGILLDGDRKESGVQCYTNSTTQCIGFAWRLPPEVGNEVQTDSVTFDLGFYTEQCRHNIPTDTGSGFVKLSPEANQSGGYGEDGENFNGDGSVSSFARGRYGDNNGDAGAWETAVGETVGSAATGNYSWTSGATVPWSYEYDSTTGEATFTLDGNSVTQAVPTPNGRVGITAKADEATMAVENVSLSIDGSGQTLTGPTAVTASNDGEGRDFQYLVLNTAFDGTQSFTVSGDATVTIQGDYAGGEEGVAFDVTLE
ncbi:choice-of-anchor W domain-containing protein [Halobacteriaceae archaeon GCM10025711]